MTSLPSWINSHIKNQITSNLVLNSEFPDWITFYSPNVAQSLVNAMDSKIIPSLENQVIHQEKGLLSRDAEFISRRLNRFSNVNLFDLAETSGDSSLPLILELIQDKKLNKYIPVTPNEAINKLAIRRLSVFTLNIKSSLFKFDQIVGDFELSDYRSQVHDIIRETEYSTTANLFMLMNSRLGNSPDPTRMLQNIYKTMSEGDYLVILQGIYRSGSENLIADDYFSFYTQPDSFLVAKEFLSPMSKEPQFRSYWESSSNFHGVKINFKTEIPFAIDGIVVDEGKAINVFRSQRFEESKLKDSLSSTGFKLIDIAYDETMDNALFFMEK